MEQMLYMPYSYDKEVQVELTIEMNRSLQIVERRGFTMLDLLSDVGGINSILASGLAFVVGFFNHHHFDTYMASKLFKIKQAGTKGFAHLRESDTFKPTRYGNTLEWIREKLPCLERLCRKSRTQRGIEKARRKLTKEINIVDIVKFQRYYAMAMEYLLETKVRKEFRRRSKFIEIDPSSSDEENKLGLEAPFYGIEEKLSSKTLTNLSKLSSTKIIEPEPSGYFPF